MDKFTLEIELGNEAMESHADIVDALNRVAFEMLSPAQPTSGAIRDINGNKVGGWRIKEVGK